MTSQSLSESSRDSPSHQQLAERLGSIRDVKLRVEYLRGLVGSMTADAIAELVALSLGPTELKRRPHAEFLLILTVVLSIEDDLRKFVVGAAASRGLSEVARFFGEAESGGEGSGRARSKPAPSNERPLTLGERKALARKPDRRLIARAMRDPHPSVVAVVLSNPGLTEDDVVRMCAARNATSATLKAIFADPRWFVRYRVRRALVMNPACPHHVAVPLSLHLTVPDARVAAQSTELSPELRETCRRQRRDTIH